MDVPQPELAPKLRATLSASGQIGATARRQSPRCAPFCLIRPWHGFCTLPKAPARGKQHTRTLAAPEYGIQGLSIDKCGT
jgi:hypothetical protein